MASKRQGETKQVFTIRHQLHKFYKKLQLLCFFLYFALFVLWSLQSLFTSLIFEIQVVAFSSYEAYCTKY